MNQTRISGERLRIGVGIATSGRRDVLNEVLIELAKQTRQPDAIFIAPVISDDVDHAFLETLSGKPVILSGPAGLTSQRNTIIKAADNFDILVFFDDDFLPCADFLQRCENAFLDYPDMAVLTGKVLHDGVHGAGLSLGLAREMIAQENTSDEAPSTTYNAYGCNMAVRMDIVRRQGVYFDEMLPLYGWLEDVDFSRRMASFGRVLKVSQCRGVHLATKRGKGSGVRLGYSQLANPFYMVGKGTLSLDRALSQIVRNVFANLSRALFSEPWIDRPGRLYGNVLAFYDLLRGEVDPRRILML